MPSSPASRPSLFATLEAAGKRSAASRRSELRFGQSIDNDERLKALVARERHFLTVVIPRYRTLQVAFIDWMERTLRWDTLLPLLFIIVMHVGVAIAAAASPDGEDIFAGGPFATSSASGEDVVDGRDTQWPSAFTSYSLLILNGLATLMLSFYANVCMDLYRDSYFACQVLKESVIDLNTLSAGTIPVEAEAVRMEFWRVINLYHLCAYVLADKTRLTYNFDSFLEPVATAYGDYDGEESLGMLTREELSLLTQAAPSRVARAAGDDTDPIRKSIRRDSSAKMDAEVESLKAELRDQGTRNKRVSAAAGAAQKKKQQQQEQREVAKSSKYLTSSAMAALKAAGAGTGTSQRSVLANIRGDVASATATLHAALGLRLYVLVDLVLKEKLSRASWPSWSSVVMKLRTASEAVKQRALFRLPRIYRASVHFFVAAAIASDTFVVACASGRLLARAQQQPEWRPHAYFGASAIFLLNVFLSWYCSMLVKSLSNMESPFGSDTLDLCGLSYVSAAAELSLRMAVGERQELINDAQDRVMAKFKRVDVEGLMHDYKRKVNKGAKGEEVVETQTAEEEGE